MNPTTTFDYDSLRARKARQALHLGHKDLYLFMVFLGWAVLLGGAAMAWFLHLSAGWLVAGMSGPFLMLAAWSHSLMDIAPDVRSHGIDSVLDADVLGRLPKDPTPKDLAGIIMQLPGGKFFAVRFGLGTEFLAPTVSSQKEDTAKVWEEALRLQQRFASPNLNGAMLAAALIRTVPHVDQYLANARVSADDIADAVGWYTNQQNLFLAHKQPRHDGGVGRDMSFGYTPMLDRFGSNVSQFVSHDGPRFQLPSRQPLQQQVLRLLSEGGRHNAALVGGLGSGKTTLVHFIAKQLLDGDKSVPHNLHYRQIIALDPSTLIARAGGRGELENLVQHLCYEALHAKNVVLFLDDAQLFFDNGNGSVDLSNILLPVLDGGALKIIMAMDEQRWLKITQANPALAQAINRINLPPADEAETMLVMQDEAMVFEYQQHVAYTYQSLVEAYRLSHRFMSEQVMPGRALKLLEAAAGSAENGLVTHRSVEEAIERTQGVKVTTADTDQERQTLLNLEQLIHQRMINQTHAVGVVSDALRRARAGVRNAERPIGTFLFLGPTGVGKTELAKSVAAVFFGGEDHLVRIDLNEFSGPNDVQRMLADAAQDQNSLTAQISKSPFSVVLLDEIEKAHPNVLNTLLQMLDEGILRDINNRQVSFRDAVVIATSNAGAERIRQHIEAGEQLEQFEEQFTNELINANIFRPEFLNRFDEIVLFRPLKPEELVQVIDLILKGVNKNLEAQKISVTVADDAKQLLVQAGYDPRLGARPMRRVVQRVVENIVANQLLSQQVSAGGQVQVTAADVQAMLNKERN